MPESLDQVAARTLAHYDQRALAYWEGTRDHDVSQNIAALLQAIATPAPLAILDFGCGPGRDLDLQGWRVHMTAAGFTELAHYYRPPGLPFEQQPWLATVWRAQVAP